MCDTSGPTSSSAGGEDVAGTAPNKVLRKILLVDDEPDGAESAASLLIAHGLEVLVAHSAQEALQVLQEDRKIDAVLTDVMMPSMSGLELAEAIRAEYPDIKIVLMSGYADSVQLKEHERAYPFANKPYRIDRILELLRR